MTELSLREEMARAIYDAVMARQGWRPISGCPKNGSVVLLTSDNPLWKYPFPAKWCAKQEWWVFADEPLNDVWAVSDLVSHWQPLPEPPKGQTNDRL